MTYRFLCLLIQYGQTAAMRLGVSMRSYGCPSRQSNIILKSLGRPFGSRSVSLRDTWLCVPASRRVYFLQSPYSITDYIEYLLLSRDFLNFKVLFSAGNRVWLLLPVLSCLPPVRSAGGRRPPASCDSSMARWASRTRTPWTSWSSDPACCTPACASSGACRPPALTACIPQPSCW